MKSLKRKESEEEYNFFRVQRWISTNQKLNRATDKSNTSAAPDYRHFQQQGSPNKVTRGVNPL